MILSLPDDLQLLLIKPSAQNDYQKRTDAVLSSLAADSKNEVWMVTKLPVDLIESTPRVNFFGFATADQSVGARKPAFQPDWNAVRLEDRCFAAFLLAFQKINFGCCALQFSKWQPSNKVQTLIQPTSLKASPHSCRLEDLASNLSPNWKWDSKKKKKKKPLRFFFVENSRKWSL